MSEWFRTRARIALQDVEEIVGWARARGQNAVLSGDLLVVDMSDGHDAVAIPVLARGETGDGGADRLTAARDEIERIDGARARVLNGVRHAAVRAGHALEMSDRGRWWGVQMGIASGDIDVGAELTTVVVERGPAGALAAIPGAAMLLGVTSVDDARSLVAHDEPPAEEVRWKSDDELMDDGSVVIDLESSGLPLDQVLSIGERAPTLAAGVAKKIGRRWFRVGGQRAVEIDFADGRATFRLREDEVASLVAARGAGAAEDELVRRFHALDEARLAAIRMARTVIAMNERFIDAADPDVADVLRYGKDEQEGEILVGDALTDELRTSSPLDVVRAWAASAGLRASGIEKSPPMEPRARALPRPSTRAGERRAPAAAADVSDEEIERVLAEARADVVVEQYAQSPSLYGRSLFELAAPSWTIPGDTWASDDWWRGHAERAWSQHEDPDAAVVLAKLDGGPVLTGGDTRPESAWELANDCARALRRATGLSDGDDRADCALEVLDLASQLDDAAAAKWLKPEQRAAIVALARETASSGAGAPFALIRLAARWGIDDVVERLAGNDSFLAWFSVPDNDVFLGTIALELSVLGPSALCEQLAVRGLRGEAAARLRGSISEAVQPFATELSSLDRVAAAIALRRCRAR